MKSVTYQHQGAQGDILMTYVDKLPENVKELEPKNGQHVLSTSETGHPHFVQAAPGIKMFTTDNPLVCYLQIDDKYANLVHGRSHDTHGTHKLLKGIIEVRRQREATPEGWRAAQD